jgi:branched-chain amino acid transport system substrate-binding protein
MSFSSLCRALATGLMLVGASAASAQNDVVKIAVIDPLSGLAAVTGANQLKTAEFFAGILNRSRGSSGPRYEIIGLDSKLNPTEAVAQLQRAIDQGVRYITHGNGSAVAAALIDAVAKHNASHPGREVLYVNQAAIDSTLTNEKCSFWHFRIDADVSMRMAAITAFVKDRPDIKRVYLINQDYSFGRQVSKFAKEGIKNRRPDVEIVGDEFIPLSKIKDFSSHVEKIKASGADTVITGNWGTDLSLLAKASVAQGYGGTFITFYADRAGAPQAFGASGLGRVHVVAATHSNMGGMANLLAVRFKNQHKEDLQSYQIIYSLMLINEGINKARSTDPVRVAAAMEDLRFEGFNGPVTIRGQDHQMQQSMFLLVMGKSNERYPNGLEGTDFTLIEEKRYDAQVASTPTTCAMERPSIPPRPAAPAVQPVAKAAPRGKP